MRYQKTWRDYQPKNHGFSVLEVDRYDPDFAKNWPVWVVYPLVGILGLLNLYLLYRALYSPLWLD